MLFEYFDDFFAFAVTFISITICFLCYVNYPRKGYTYAIIMLLFNQISNYFWVIYVLVIGEHPEAYSMLAYIGWDIGYIFMFLMVMHFKCSEERRYINPIMFLPIPLNILQFFLYLPYGGVINIIWQGIICSSIACMSLQSILWYIKERKKRDIMPPYVSIAMFSFITCEYSMWTASCMDWPNDWVNPYTYLSPLSYVILLFVPLFIQKNYGKLQAAYSPFGFKKYKLITNIISSMIVGLFSFSGYLLGSWMRDILVSCVNEDSIEEAYTIIAVILFVLTIMITVMVILVVLFVGFVQKLLESNMLKEEKTLADKANSAKSEFLASMSHEIRTPINAVLGMNEMILRESRAAYNSNSNDSGSTHNTFGEIINYASSVDSAGNNLLSIVNDILDFSKIEAGKLDIIEGNYNLGSMIHDIANMLLFRAREKNLIFNVEADEMLPSELFGDEKRVRQAVINLLTNAVKYTDKGSVKLAVRRGDILEDGKLEIRFIVSDTGIGIRKEDMDKLFDKFRRVDMERNKKVEGTGLGLAITQNLTYLMGGSVEVESEYGRGSTFTLKIPQRVVNEEKLGNFKEKYTNNIKEGKVYEEIFRAPSAKLLIVDDNKINIIVLKKLLKKTEVGIDEVLTGTEAIRLSDENKYDVILMDNRMPEMDGSEVLKLIRSSDNGKNHDTPVICLTADAVSDARKRYLAEGFSDYMSKPVRGDELEKMLLRFIPKGKIEYMAGKFKK